MRTNFNGILTLLLAFIVQVSLAQTTVSGTVSEENGPLPGASVLIKGTQTGTQTDFDGKYSIDASPTDILVFSYVGYTTQEAIVASKTILNITMASDSQLDEVIVTAQGVKREKKALGYSVATVSAEEIQSKPESDVTRTLLGKASGVQITQASGTAGSGTRVVIRGYNSISGNNQALFIVDGVPFDNSTLTVANLNGSSRSLDLDPNNIESVSVLKGLAAATLYGADGRNGVVLITTKTGSTKQGSKKNEVSVSQSYFSDQIASLPDYQSEFGNGFDQQFQWAVSNWGPSFERDALGGFASSDLIDENGTIAHPYFTSSSTDHDFFRDQFENERYEFRAYNSVERFFRTGGLSNSNVSFRGGTDKVSYNMSYSHNEQKGFLPGNSVRRNNLSLGGRAKLSNKFNVSGNFNFSRSDFKTPPVVGSNGNASSSVIGTLFFTPRSVDLIGLPFENPVTGASVYYRQDNSIQNPLWTVANAQVASLTNRINGNAVVGYDFNENLNIFYRTGLDISNSFFSNHQNRGGISNPLGFLSSSNVLTQVFDHSVVLNGDYDLSNDFGLTFNIGATSRRNETEQVGANSTGQNVFGVVEHFNFNESTAVGLSTFNNTLGVYSQAALDYKDLLFLTVAGRNDWVSNLVAGNNSLFYPSVSLSFIPTKAFESLRSDSYGLNYLKLRASLGSSARFPTGFPTSQRLSSSTQAFQFDGQDIITNTTSGTRANPALNPELQREFEFGFESKLLNNRVTLEASYYDRTTEDLIVNSPLAASTGFTSSQINIGEIQGEGYEVDLGIDIFKSDNNGFNWNSRVNFTTNTSIVTDLGQGEIEQIIFGLGNVAREGEVLGAVTGSQIARDPVTGEFLVDSAGLYVVEFTDQDGLAPIIGDPNPDFVMNYINTMSYKNFNVGFQINHTQGGDISSATISTLLGRGLAQETTDRLNTVILPGVLQETGEPNTIQLTTAEFFFDNLFNGPGELRIYDASVLRLQEVSFGYNFTKKILDSTPFGSLSITASGQNLWFDAYNTPDSINFDPQVAFGVNNARGVESFNGPSGKRYGVAIKATF